jgi:Fe-S oxidoreductase
LKDTTQAIKATGARFCLDCGKCTAVCPVARVNDSFSPRRIVVGSVSSGELATRTERLWDCLTCKLCSEKCPSDVDYVDLTKVVRIDAHGAGEEGLCAHGSTLHELMRIMTTPKLNQNRLGWITEDLKVSEKSDYLYFVGCLPYFDAYFEELDVSCLDIARSTVRLLNAAGIEPVILPDERCCGHDLLWAGDLANFEKLAKHNIEKFKESGAKRIITSCPEGAATFKLYYPEVAGSMPLDVLHLVEFLDEQCSSGALRFKTTEKSVTYQDPCRLGRFLGVYEQPRNLLRALFGDGFSDMRRSGQSAICCGTSGWMNCGIHSKSIQTQRLREARLTGSTLLATACVKCKIHFACAMKDVDFPEEARIQVEDLAVLAASSLEK